MAEILLFHHAHGQTEGFHAFAYAPDAAVVLPRRALDSLTAV